MSEVRNAATSGRATVESATSRVISHVESLVFEKLEPRQALPSEGALATDLGVSRLTVREAIGQLAARGLVETHNGKRPVVAAPNARGVRDFLRSALRRDPRAELELEEVQRALDGHCTMLAARSAGRATLAALRGTIEDARRGVSTFEELRLAERQFHELIAAASGNQLLLSLVVEVADGRSGRGGNDAPERPDLDVAVTEMIEHHATILDRVESHDEVGALAILRLHQRQATF